MYKVISNSNDFARLIEARVSYLDKCPYVGDFDLYYDQETNAVKHWNPKNELYRDQNIQMHDLLNQFKQSTQDNPELFESLIKDNHISNGDKLTDIIEKLTLKVRDILATNESIAHHDSLYETHAMLETMKQIIDLDDEYFSGRIDRFVQTRTLDLSDIENNPLIICYDKNYPADGNQITGIVEEEGGEMHIQPYPYPIIEDINASLTHNDYYSL